MKHAFTLALSALVLGPVAASAAISAVTQVDKDFSLSPDPMVDPAYFVSGSWTPLTHGDLTVKNDTYWKSLFLGRMLDVGGVDVWVLFTLASHKLDPAAPVFGAALGMADIAGNSGTVNSYVDHWGDGGGDYYLFTANINPKGQMNFELRASHVIPEPATFAMVAGLGLVGFASCRRSRKA